LFFNADITSPTIAEASSSLSLLQNKSGTGILQINLNIRFKAGTL
jgi:hypothetical protein